MTGWPLVGNEGINLYIGILGIHEPSFPTSRASWMRFFFMSCAESLEMFESGQWLERMR